MTERGNQRTIGDEDDGLGLGTVLRLRDVRGEATDFVLSPGWLAFMHLATQAAVAHHAYMLFRHFSKSESLKVRGQARFAGGKVGSAQFVVDWSGLDLGAIACGVK